MDIKKLKKILLEIKYSEKEINKTIQWLKDEENGDVYSAEEVYKSLFFVEKEYA